MESCSQTNILVARRKKKITIFMRLAIAFASAWIGRLISSWSNILVSYGLVIYRWCQCQEYIASMIRRWMNIEQLEEWELPKKIKVLEEYLQPQIPNFPTWDRTRAATVGSRRVTVWAVWAMARISCGCIGFRRGIRLWCRQLLCMLILTSSDGFRHFLYAINGRMKLTELQKPNPDSQAEI
jgi:hypothetical protein